jgi:arylsulfatase A-like enzyme
MDWTATILAAARAAGVHSLDGADLLPVITGSKAVQDRTFFWRIGDQDAVRQGRWKYLREGGQRRLFDLSTDQREQANFSNKSRDVFDRLTAEFDNWNKQMLPRLKRNG